MQRQQYEPAFGHDLKVDARIDVVTEWRRQRNIISEHVSVKCSQLSLTSFRERNHMYVYTLYYNCKGFWGRPKDEFPDLDVTAFSVMIKAAGRSVSLNLRLRIISPLGLGGYLPCLCLK